MNKFTIFVLLFNYQSKLNHFHILYLCIGFWITSQALKSFFYISLVPWFQDSAAQVAKMRSFSQFRSEKFWLQKKQGRRRGEKQRGKWFLGLSLITYRSSTYHMCLLTTTKHIIVIFLNIESLLVTLVNCIWYLYYQSTYFWKQVSQV